MQQRLNSRIEQWGKTLSRDDFEWTRRGRQMKPAKRQEVCDIFQGVVKEMYQMAVKNKARLSPEDQKLYPIVISLLKNWAFKITG